MSIQFVPKTGKVISVKKYNGNKNGKEWYKTSFGISTPYYHNGEQKFENNYFDVWENIDLADGDIVTVDGSFRKEKKLNGDGYEWKPFASKVTKHYTADGAPVDSAPQSSREDFNDDIPF